MLRHTDLISRQKLTNNEWDVTRCIIVQQRPGLWITIFGSNTTDSDYETLQNCEVICASICLTSSNEFLVDNFIAIEECNQHLTLAFWVVLEAPCFVTHNNWFQEVWIISGGCNDFFEMIDFFMLVFQHRQKSCFGRTVIILLFINRLKQNFYYCTEKKSTLTQYLTFAWIARIFSLNCMGPVQDPTWDVWCASCS